MPSDVEHGRADALIYLGQPMTREELSIGDLPVELDLHDSDVDFDAVYG